MCCPSRGSLQLNIFMGGRSAHITKKTVFDLNSNLYTSLYGRLNTDHVDFKVLFTTKAIPRVLFTPELVIL